MVEISIQGFHEYQHIWSTAVTNQVKFVKKFCGLNFEDGEKSAKTSPQN